MTHLKSEKQKQRRRGILKAAAGVPMIFTLPIGSAVAATSLTCIDKSQALATQVTPQGASTGPDTWVRYKVEQMTIKTTGQGGGTSTNAFNLGGSWYTVNEDKSVSAVSNEVQTSGTNAPASYTPAQYYYLLVDHKSYLNSTINSPESFVYLGTGVVNPIAGASCWNSVTPGASLSTNVLN